MHFKKRSTVIHCLFIFLSLFFLQATQSFSASAHPNNSVIYTIYDDTLATGWTNDSSSDSSIDLASQTHVYAGSRAISFTAQQPFAGLYLDTTNALDTSSYTNLQFAAQATRTQQHYSVVLYDVNQRPLTRPVLLTSYGGDPVVGTWKLYTIPLTALHAQGKQVTALLIQSQSSTAQPALYIDAIRLTNQTASGTTTPGSGTTNGGTPTTGSGTPGSTPTTGSGTTTTSTGSWSSHAMAWIYPGAPACHAALEYKDGRTIDTLKPQYFTLNDSGTLDEQTVDIAGCNGYSAANAADIKQYSKHQYVTIAGNTTGMTALVNDPTKMTTTINTLKSFLDTVGFTGVEIDFEGFSNWNAQQYSGYKTFLTKLGTTLHQHNYKLMVDGPNATATSGTYQWRYADFNSLPVDYVVVMAYDWQFDDGVGTPIASYAEDKALIQSVLTQVTDRSKLVIGIPSYGYHGTNGSYTPTIDTNAQSQAFTGYSSATRDASSGEMMFSNGNQRYDYSDSQTLNAKRTLIESLGIQNVSVWHLGGNQWFSGKTEPAS